MMIRQLLNQKGTIVHTIHPDATVFDAIAKMAEKDQLTGGLMIKTSNGNAIQNPLVGTANKAASDMMRYAAEFGMTPSARTRIETQASDQNADPADRFFG